MGAAMPSVNNAHNYWLSVACTAFTRAHTFWCTLQDYSSSPTLGVVDANDNPTPNLACDV